MNKQNPVNLPVGWTEPDMPPPIPGPGNRLKNTNPADEDHNGSWRPEPSEERKT